MNPPVEILEAHDRVHWHTSVVEWNHARRKQELVDRVLEGTIVAAGAHLCRVKVESPERHKGKIQLVDRYSLLKIGDQPA